ncbi:hypothetical protein O7599_12820 [Streptomyces sp. WMMC500]|uniref:hypothetical protein n=1 Tax=Streptomyces sp. WMMC500 TaxID=3015154 RepID=UPI00248BA9B3|nr:hypothetical protein [Streptomyces sp. WMMC500]WBB63350.1 hypothetical protein O7599_12820 [Streptomyces sp. WMMC500]
MRNIVSSIVLLAFLSGCSSRQDIEPEVSESRAGGVTEFTRASLTTAELKALTFKDGEVPQAYEGGMQVTAFSAEDEESEFPPVSDPDCQVMHEALSGERASSGVSQMFNWKDSIFASGSIIAAYPEGLAQGEFDRFQQALDSCRSYEGEGYAGDFEASIEAKSTAGFGDESVTFVQIIPSDHPDDPRERMKQFTVVRVDSVIATFHRYDLGRVTPFPAELIETQVERLAEAQDPQRV